MEFRRSKPGSNGGRGGGGGYRRPRNSQSGGGGGHSNSRSQQPPANDHYSSSRSYRDSSPRMPDMKSNAWDDHAAEVDEQKLRSAGLIAPRHDRASSRDGDYADRHSSNGYHHEASPYRDDYADVAGRREHDGYVDSRRRDDDYDDERRYEQDYQRQEDHHHQHQHQEQYQNGGDERDHYPAPPPHHDYSPAPHHDYSPAPAAGDGYGYEVSPPPQPHHSGRSDDAVDDYRARPTHQRSSDPTTISSIEEEYRGWNWSELERECSRLQRRLDVAREMRTRAEDYERGQQERNYSPQHGPPPSTGAVGDEDGAFVDRVRDAESYYDRDGYSPLGRAAWETQRRRNEQSRGYIPASGLDRYGNHSSNGREETSRRDGEGGGRGRGRGGDGHRRGDEGDEQSRREGGGSQRGGGENGHYYRSSGASESESRQTSSSRSKKRRSKQSRGAGSSAHRHGSVGDSDECSGSSSAGNKRSSGYSTNGSTASLATPPRPSHQHATIHEHPRDVSGGGAPGARQQLLQHQRDASPIVQAPVPPPRGGSRTGNNQSTMMVETTGVRLLAAPSSSSNSRNLLARGGGVPPAVEQTTSAMTTVTTRDVEEPKQQPQQQRAMETAAPPAAPPAAPTTAKQLLLTPAMITAAAASAAASVASSAAAPTATTVQQPLPAQHVIQRMTMWSPSGGPVLASEDDMTNDRGGRGGRGGGRGGDRDRGSYRGGSNEYRGRGGGAASGSRGGYGGGGGRVENVTAGMRSMTVGGDPPPLPFLAPAAGEQSGYKAAARPAPALREGKQKVHVISNVWELEYEDRIVYRYDVSVGLEAIGNDGSSRIFSINKGPKDDASVHERNELIRAALKRGLEMYRLLSERGCIAVDGAAMMYANESLDAELKQCGYKIGVRVEDLPEEVRQFIRNSSVKNVVIEVTATNQFNIKDLSGQTSIDRSEIDQSVKQFFEVVTSEHAINTHQYAFFTGGNLYRDDPDRHRMGGGNRFARDIGSGQERRDGMSKGFTLAEKNGRIIGALNIDVTTGTFWTEQRLVQTICDINGWDRPINAVWNERAIKRTNDLIKNLRVSYTPADGGPSFDFIAAGTTASTWKEKNGDVERKKVLTMEDLTCKNAVGHEEPLFNKFGKADLKLLNWPLVETKRAKRRADDPTQFELDIQHFPIELLSVKANQRVPLRKQGAEPERAMPVEDRWRGTAAALEALNLFGGGGGGGRGLRNSVMEAFGIRLSRKPLETDGIRRRMPGVVFKKDADIDDKTTFRTGMHSFRTPAHITQLIIAVSDSQHRFDVQNFARALLDAAKKKGMRIDSYVIETVLPNKVHDTLKKISENRKKGDAKLQKVIFLYVEPEASKKHDELKLFERRFCVITQHLTMENAAKLAGSRPTLENVLLKLNVKGGGHNYNVQPEKFAHALWMVNDRNVASTMIMGYDVWHPTGQTRVEKMADRMPEPSVVGFSFNGGVNPDSFVGDYHYQQPTRESVNDDVLNARIKWMLGAFESSRGCLPPLIVVIRDGISDGQYRHGMDELEALREGASEWAASDERKTMTGKPANPNYSPQFIFVIATKRHHKRLFTETHRGHANMPAMTVVDDTITNPALFEFFLQSHTPLQGMAKATKYTVLKDDVGTTSDAMQALMSALCFEHQVSTNAISIPEPVYQSDEWAKRGAANMRKFKEVYGDQGQFKAGMDYETLTDKLAYWKSALATVRVNA